MTLDIARRVVLASRPAGAPAAENFRLEEYRIPLPGPGEVLLHTRYLSLDPYMRGRMSDAPSYAAPVAVGAVMEGGTVSEVIASNSDAFAEGDIVLGHTGWQTHAISNGKGLRKLDPAAGSVSYALGVLGMPGMTAYFGLAIKGARAVGVAGGAEKCRYVKDELGFDACIDHRAPDFAAQLKAACPNGIDVYFENVGGKVFEAVVPLLNNYARVPVCGVISHYNDSGAEPSANWVPALMRSVLSKRINMRGFIVSDFYARRDEFIREMPSWLKDGRVKYREHVIEGLENAPRGLIGLLRGENFGKTLVRVATKS